MFPLDAKILIVDDSTFARMALKNALKELEYSKILEAGDARAAQKMMQEPEHQSDPIHLLITDIHMPEMTGLDLLRWVRSQDKMRSLPVIMLTSSQEKGEVLEAGKMGVSHYMIKPFEGATLKEKLSSTWARHGEKYYEFLKRTP